MDVATLLARCRRRAGLTQRQLAERADTSPAAVCLYERGERVPRVDTLIRLVAATGSTLDVRALPPPASIDVEANGRALEQVLALADALPQRHSPELGAPPFAAMAAAHRGRG